MPLFFILPFLLTTSAFANSYININGQNYQSSNNGSVSVVNGIVIDGNVVNGQSNNNIRGNNKKSTETRKLNYFGQLYVKLSADIEIFYDKQPHIQITSDENILPLISSNIEQGRLTLSTKANFWTKNSIKIKVYTPKKNPLNRIEIDGATTLKMNNIMQRNLAFIINGTGEITATGQVQQLMASINGAGDMFLENLYAQYAQVNISGSGDINVYASHQLSAQISGSGDIHFKGSPKQIKTSITGSGDIDAYE